MVSVVIPSYRDPLLNKTVESLLENCSGEIEIICVLDGYWASPIADPRVKVIHLGRNRGMREAINVGVMASSGEYIMRTDEHCVFAPGYDVKLIQGFQENWIVVPRRYFLDPVKWEIMDIPPVDYSDLSIRGHGEQRKFTGTTNEWATQNRTMFMIDETFAMQGSCWIMKKSWWDRVIGKLDTAGYGPLYQDSIEMIFKTWQFGGHLMVNKTTWYAHKHRQFKRTHNNGTKENPSNNEACWSYALKVWEGFYNDLLKENRINSYDEKPNDICFSIEENG